MWNVLLILKINTFSACSSGTDCKVWPFLVLIDPVSLLFKDLFAMETDMIPKFSSKDEEIDFWKALSLKYKNRYVVNVIEFHYL